MNQDTRWMRKYNELKDFIEVNRRNPSKHRIEEHDMLNFIKHNRKLLKESRGQELLCRITDSTDNTGFSFEH